MYNYGMVMTVFHQVATVYLVPGCAEVFNVFRALGGGGVSLK